MLVYAGIDEAGYGPMLGPLCIGATVFVLDEHDAADGPPNLWSMLAAAVCRGKRDRRRRVAVDDSKKLKGANTGGGAHPLHHLERAVLAFGAAVAGPDEPDLPPNDATLLSRLGATVTDQPWYRSSTTLPVAQDEDSLRIAASRVRRAMDRQAARCVLMRCETIDAGVFNEAVGRTRSKSTVNFEGAMRLVDAVWRGWPAAHPRIIIDRHGGRTHYREELQLAFPDAALRVVAESEAVSRYRLERAGSALTVSFVREAESRHLPVALGSMIAKYVRELLMLRLNRFFSAHRPGLRPTAGYVQDARRYLDDIAPVIRDLRVPRRDLVRSV